MRLVALVAFVMFGLPAAVWAQTAQSPYRGQEARPIKALSSDEIGDYLAGAGLGYAKAAELNGYPGPRHVLDLASELDLTAEQKAMTQAIWQRMNDAAVPLGQVIVDREAELDKLFATRQIDDKRLAALTDEIGALDGRLRAVHLKAHLELTALLSRHQIVTYDRLRGYAGGGGHGGHGADPRKH